MDWFLYDRDTVIKEFKEIPQILFECKFFYSGVCVSELGAWGVALDYVYREKLFVKQNSAF